MSSPPSVGVIGTGHMGGLHVEKLVRLAGEGVVRVAGIHDIDGAKADANGAMVEQYT